MKRFHLLAACVVMCLVASAAAAHECKPIQARIGQSLYLDPCTYDGTEYVFCIEQEITGTINGTWHYYGQGDAAEGYPDPPFSSVWAGWGLDVFETNRGEIYSQSNWLANLGIFDLVETEAVFPLATISTITGGTGTYEGAWGWIGMIYDDVGDWKGFMKGEICTPDDE